MADPHCRQRHPVRLRRDRARGRQRPRRTATTADAGRRERQIVGYRLNGRKQWISNGGIADAYTILALAPGGPSWFVLERGAEGFTQSKPEDKHGIRLSNTAALFLDDVFVPVENLVGGVEGQGLVQAQQVFGYTRLMVAAFGLGAAGRPSIGRSPTPRSASRPAPHCQRSRATRTS